MNKNFVVPFLLTLVLVSCKKPVSETIPAPAEAQLIIQTIYNTGQQRTDTLNISNTYSSAYFDITNDGTRDRLLVNVGGITANPVSIPFGLTFVFQSETDPVRISGNYVYSQGNTQLRSAYRYEVNTLRSETNLLPESGLINFTYDAISKSLGGTINNLTYQHQLTSEPVHRTRSVINGSFRYIRRK
jgi:hypothetical protein